MRIVTKIKKQLDRLEYTLLPQGHFKDKVFVILYHCVSPEKHPILRHMGETIWTREKDFIQQMKYIADHYYVASVDEFIQGGLDRQSVLIMFDDGFRDVFYYAYPVLQRLNLPFTICMNSGFLDNTEMFWLAKITLLKSKGLLEDFCTRYGIREEISKWMNNRTLNNRLKDFFLEMGIDEMAAARQYRLYLDQNEVRKMSADRLTVLPHTHYHFKTTDLTYQQRKTEIETSIRILSKTFPDYYSPVFSFPFGSPNQTFDRTDLDILRQNGIQYYLSAADGINSLKKKVFEIKRKSVCEGQSLDGFKYFIEKPQYTTLWARDLKLKLTAGSRRL